MTFRENPHFAIQAIAIEPSRENPEAEAELPREWAVYDVNTFTFGSGHLDMGTLFSIDALTLLEIGD